MKPELERLPLQDSAPTSAEVLSVPGDDEVLVRLHHARTEEVLHVELAVVGYRAAPGDRVLVSSDGRYVIGVLGAARRRSCLTEQSGSVTLSSTRRLVIRAPEIEILADQATMDTGTLIERSEHSHRFAKEAHASFERSRTCVAGESESIAGRTSIVSEGDTVVDGARVLLG